VSLYLIGGWDSIVWQFAVGWTGVRDFLFCTFILNGPEAHTVSCTMAMEAVS